MNERLRKWAMKIIIGMIQDKIAEWEVRRYALDNYNKGILTSEDLDKIDEMYKEEEPVESEQVDEQVSEQDEENASYIEQDALMQHTEDEEE